MAVDGSSNVSVAKTASGSGRRPALSGSMAHRAGAELTVHGKWEKMGLCETFSKGSSPISQCSAMKRRGIGSAVGCHRKLFI